MTNRTNSRKLKRKSLSFVVTRTGKKSSDKEMTSTTRETEENVSEFRRGLQEIRRTGRMPESVRRNTPES